MVIQCSISLGWKLLYVNPLATWVNPQRKKPPVHTARWQLNEGAGDRQDEPDTDAKL